MVNEQGFNPSQLEDVNDVVQRAGFSDKRKRNLAIRSGMENQGQFQQENASGIQQAQQPSEFLGAGRKMAANQNPDAGLASLFNGPLTKSSEGWQYFGDTDYSTAQAGTAGYDTKGIGGGKYDISRGGSSIGTGYYDTGTAASQLSGGAYNPQGHGRINDWEAIGQYLNGTGGGSAGTTSTSFAHNARDENVAGLNTLYGSTPIINSGKLLGYTINPNASGPTQPYGLNPQSAGQQHNIAGQAATPARWVPVSTGGWWQGARSAVAPSSETSQLWRSLNNPETWGNYGKSINNDTFFLKADKASEFPGWTNKEYYNKITGTAPSTPWYSNALSQLSPLISAAGGAGGLASGFITNTALNAIKGGGISSLFGNSNQGHLSGAPIVNAAAANTKQPVGKLEGATSSDLNSLFNQGQAIRGSEFGGRAGGLSSFLNMNPQGKEMPQQFEQEPQQRTRASEYNRRG